MEGYALKKWESTLNLCAHAHGHDVDPIMEASCNNNYFLVIISSGICELILGNRGSDYIFSLIPFPTQVEALVFCRSTHLRNLYFDLPQVLPSGISRISKNGVASMSLHLVLVLTDFRFPSGSRLLVTREHR